MIAVDYAVRVDRQHDLCTVVEPQRRSGLPGLYVCAVEKCSVTPYRVTVDTDVSTSTHGAYCIGCAQCGSVREGDENHCQQTFPRGHFAPLPRWIHTLLNFFVSY